MRTLPLLTLVMSVLASAACNTGQAKPEPKPVASPVASPTKPEEGVLRLGAAIAPSAKSVTLAEVAKDPTSFVGQTFTTSGTVTAVCQHMGCWMELKDASGEAHVKMAGHAFFVPKSASGRKARVMATLVKPEGEGACEGEGHAHGAHAGDGKMAAAGESNTSTEKPKGCRAEAEAQLGRPLSKLELVAEGVELL